MVTGSLSTWTSTDIVSVVLRSRESRRACVFGYGLLCLTVVICATDCN
jgi:hypothetical protein